MRTAARTVVAVVAALVVALLVDLARRLGFSLGPAPAAATWALTGYALDGMRAALGLGAGPSALGALALARIHARPPAHVNTVPTTEGRTS